MIQLSYTLVGEGFAEYEFIPAYFNWLSKLHKIDLIRSRVQLPISKQGGISRVFEAIKPLCEQSFLSNRPVNLFVAGVDLDKPDHTDEQTHWKSRTHELIKCLGKLHQKFEDKIILFVPVQAIDHWIHYQQDKSITHSLESKSRDELKKLVYGKKDADRQTIKRIARSIGEKADFAQLATQSKSFKRFHDRVTAFLNLALQ